MRATVHRIGEGGSAVMSRLRAASRLEPQAAVTTAAYFLGFALLCHFLSAPDVSPPVAGTDIRLISFQAALLNLALMLRPRWEMGVYMLIYAVIGLAFHSGTASSFDVARMVVDIGQALAFSIVVRRYYPMIRQVGRPDGVLVYSLTAFAICGLGATLLIAAAGMVSMTSAEIGRELAGDPMLIWRHWWLGHTCAFVTIAAAIRFIILRGTKLREDLPDTSYERRAFVVMIGVLLAVGVVMFPIHDISPLGLPADVRIALTLVPAPFGFALAARYRGTGAAIAILILTPLAILSVTGPYAYKNWAGLPPMATPMHVFLIMTAMTCWTLAAISRQRGWAIAEANEARNAKARFVAQMNHELRTPLNAILGFSELIRMQNLRELREAVGPLENIHASGQRLLAMIEGLLGQAERGSTVFDLEKQPVRLSAAIRDAVDELKGQYEELRCNATVSADDHILIDADPRALRQMLHVLLAYPLRFAGPESNVAVRATETGSDTLIEVQSSGLINAVADDRDKIELQLVSALALAHGARLQVVQRDRGERSSLLTFFATQAA